jgi:hypothetical protein
MNVQIHASSFSLTNGLRGHFAWRAAYATNHGRDTVSRVAVHLSDVNGPRGGVDKLCGIELRLKDAQALVVEDVQSVVSASPEGEAHDYRKDSDQVHFTITQLPQDKVKATIVAVLP